MRTPDHRIYDENDVEGTIELIETCLAASADFGLIIDEERIYGRDAIAHVRAQDSMGTEIIKRFITQVKRNRERKTQKVLAFLRELPPNTPASDLSHSVEIGPNSVQLSEARLSSIADMIREVEEGTPTGILLTRILSREIAKAEQHEKASLRNILSTVATRAKVAVKRAITF